ncbi:hypothetical protein [Ahniella affigens]|uniref:hypothetical protein n=1 Tax=Ahniella affigens TaxID=2021234 RepID=UPI0011B24047|nr:hypothetical protein [Ahniella affigens]
MRDVVAFGTAWQDERDFLRRLCREYTRGDAAFAVDEQHQGDRFERLSPLQFASRLKRLREIELEQQMFSDLENGFIASRAEFEPHDMDWTQEVAQNASA